MTTCTGPSDGAGRASLIIARRHELDLAQLAQARAYLTSQVPAAGLIAIMPDDALVEIAAQHGGARVREALAAGIAAAIAGKEPGEPEPRQPGTVTWYCSRCGGIEVSEMPAWKVCPACMAGEPFWLPAQSGLPRCGATDLGSCCNSQQGRGQLHMSWSRGEKRASWPVAPEPQGRPS